MTHLKFTEEQFLEALAAYMRLSKEDRQTCRYFVPTQPLVSRPEDIPYHHAAPTSLVAIEMGELLEWCAEKYHGIRKAEQDKRVLFSMAYEWVLHTTLSYRERQVEVPQCLITLITDMQKYISEFQIKHGSTTLEYIHEYNAALRKAQERR